MNPVLVRQLVLPMHELLCRRGTLRYLRSLEGTQWLSRGVLQRIRQEKLRALLTHAHAHCPFYRAQLDDAGVDPRNATPEDLRRIPTLTKAQIAEHAPTMIAAGASGRLFPYSTGGSTGASLQFYICRRRQASDQAARARSRRWFGVDLGERELYLWGSPIEQRFQDRARRLRDRLTNQRLLDAFDMTPRTMAAYLAELRRFDPVHLFGYPSSIARLVRFARESGISVRAPSLRAVFVTGETFAPPDRAVIEETFGVPVADGYGAREAGFIAHQCPAGAYHVTMESHLVEWLDAGGRPVGPGEPGEITITHLDAFGMPFVRYRTGDVARPCEGECPCGRGLETISTIEGRRTDMLRTARGGYAHGLSVIYVLRELPEVREFKIVQRENMDLDVFIVPRGELTPATRARIAVDMKARLGADIDVRVIESDRIEPDPSGKHRQVVGAKEI